MRCPDSIDLMVKYFFFRWMFNVVQAAAIVGIWELKKFLYRMSDPLTEDPCRGRVAARHKKPPNSTNR